MVEIDEMVVNACKQFIPQTSGALDDPKIELILGTELDTFKKTQKNSMLLLSTQRIL